MHRMEKHLIKHKSENTPKPREAAFFISYWIWYWRGKWRNEENKMELGCCTCRLNHTEKIRPRKEWEALNNVFGRSIGIGLRLLSWSRQVLVWLCVDHYQSAVWVSDCTHICVIVCERLSACALWGRMCYSSSTIVPTFPHTLPSFLASPPPQPPGCGQQTGTDCSVLLLYLEMTCGVIGDDDWPGGK